jgi:hypothetical protein
MATSVTPNPKKFSVQFESVIPGKPLDETVWDNVSGPFWDVKESNQIGFTQDYAKFIPVVIAGGVVGGVIGGAVVGASGGPELVDTRIVIPFGRIFHGVFQSGLKQAFPNSTIFVENESELNNVQSETAGRIIKLKVTEFYVWEKPLNHLNLKATVQARVCRAGQSDDSIFTYEAHGLVTGQSIGSVMTTSSGFIESMNKISNEFAASLADDLLKNLEKSLQDK